MPTPRRCGAGVRAAPPFAVRTGRLLTTSLTVVALSAATPERPAFTTRAFALPQAVNGPSVTAPTSANLGSAKPGSTVSIQLGPVTVPNSGISKWTATVSATDLRTGAGTAAETIPGSRLSYWSGPVVSRSGVGTFTPGQPTQASAQSLDTPRTAFAYTGVSSSTSVTWRPTVVVAVPATAVAGNYTGTVTHSVA